MKIWIGILVGFIHLGLGFLIAEGGHGWVSGFFLSFSSLIAYPLIGLAIKQSRYTFFIYIFFAHILLSILLYIGTKIEGVEYFYRVLSASALLMILYFIFWVGWGVISLYFLLKFYKKAKTC